MTFERIAERGRKAVSPVVATLLVITIVVSVSASVLYWGVPYIERAKAIARQSDMYNQFKLFEETVESLLGEGPGATKENKFSIIKGMLWTKNDGCRVIMYYSLDKDHNFSISGLNDKDDTFHLTMIKGNCTKVKVYFLGTETAYSRFNPPPEVELEITSNPSGYYNDTHLYTFFKNQNAGAWYTLDGSYEPLSPAEIESNCTNYSINQIENISLIPGNNSWSGNGTNFVNLYYLFKIKEPIEDIIRLNVSWYGCDTLRAGGNFSLYIWNASSSNWERWVYVTPPPIVPIPSTCCSTWYNETFNLTQGSFTYVWPNGEGENCILLAVVGGKSSGVFAGLLNESYVAVNVTYRVYDAYAPKTYITKVNGVDYNSTNLPFEYWDPQSITINWTAYDPDELTSKDEFVYKYRLDPLDTEWKPGGTDPTKVTKNTSITLKPSDFGRSFFPRGNYTFRVRARDKFGKWDRNETIFNTYRFTIHPKNITKAVNIQEGTSSYIDVGENLNRPLILIELFDNTQKFGKVWIMDFVSLEYRIPSVAGTYGVSLENGGIIYIAPGNIFVKEGPPIIEEKNRLILHTIQLSTEGGYTFSIGGEGITYTISSKVAECQVRERNTVIYMLRLQFFGDFKEVWENYFEVFYHFRKFGNDLIYPIDRNNPIKLLFIHTIAELAGKV